MKFTLRQITKPLSLALISLTLIQAAPASAQTYPTKPIRLVVPWRAGSPADVAGRIVAERMSAGLGQAIVVDNKPGASGTMGLTEVLRQPADGYTLYMLSSASLVTPLLYPDRQLDFQNSLEPVGLVIWSYNVLVAPVTSTYRNATDVVDAARAKPNSLSFASGGNGTPAHLAGELLKQQTGTTSTHVPYNQFGMAIGDLVSGRTNYMFLTASTAIPQITGGKLRPLATTSAERLPALKNVPTMKELGFNDFVLRSFDGLTVRAGTPIDIVNRLNAALNKTLVIPEVREQLATLALAPEAMTPRQFGTVLATEQEKWLSIGRAAHIKAD